MEVPTLNNTQGGVQAGVLAHGTAEGKVDPHKQNGKGDIMNGMMSSLGLPTPRRGSTWMRTVIGVNPQAHSLEQEMGENIPYIILPTMKIGEDIKKTEKETEAQARRGKIEERNSAH